MSGKNLRQLWFSYRTRGPFTENKERIQKYNKTGNSKFVYQNEKDSA